MYLTKLRSRAELQQSTTPSVGGSLTDAQRAKTAQAIIDAGRKRRGEIPDAPQAISPAAAAILAAGRRRRSEQE